MSALLKQKHAKKSGTMQAESRRTKQTVPLFLLYKSQLRDRTHARTDTQRQTHRAQDSGHTDNGHTRALNDTSYKT